MIEYKTVDLYVTDDGKRFETYRDAWQHTVENYISTHFKGISFSAVAYLSDLIISNPGKFRDLLNNEFDIIAYERDKK